MSYQDEINGLPLRLFRLGMADEMSSGPTCSATGFPSIFSVDSRGHEDSTFSSSRLFMPVSVLRTCLFFFFLLKNAEITFMYYQTSHL